MGFEPMNTGFADQRVSHFAIGARNAEIRVRAQGIEFAMPTARVPFYCGCAVVRR
jgi:hypothetical protein